MESNIIYFEKFLETDYDLFYDLVSNAEVMQMVSGHPLSPEEARTKFNSLLKFSALNPLFGSFKTFESKTGKFIGFSKLETREKGSKKAELGYLLLPQFWGKGYGSEIARVLVIHARTQNLMSLWADIDPENAASRRILIKAGFASNGRYEKDGLKGERLGLSLTGGL